ncbi:abortive infection system toxin AbiGii family protein [Enterococcus faecalis]
MGFKEAFEEENEIELSVGPKSWQSYINKIAPKNTHYEYDKKSQQYLLVPNNTEEKVSFKLKLKLPKELKNIRIEHPNDLNTLLYRYQKPVEISISEANIGEISIDPHNLTKAFGQEIKEQNKKYYLIPEKFGKAVKIPVKFNNEIYDFWIEQKPYPSLEKIIFESNTDDIFFLKLIMNQTTQKLNISLTYNFKKSNSLDELYKNQKKLKNFASGKIEIFGIEPDLFDQSELENIQNMIDFYTKLYEVQESINNSKKENTIKFDISQSITNSDIINLERLYVSLILGKYYFYPEKSRLFSLTLTEDIKNKIDKTNKFAMLGYTQVDIHLLNENIEMIEQFVFKEVSSITSDNISSSNENISDTSKLDFNIEGDQFTYRKLLFDDVQNNDMDVIISELERAQKIG